MNIASSGVRWPARFFFSASLIAGLACFSLAAADAPTARDWKASPAIVTVQTSHDLYAVGDLHGDYDKAVKLLLGAGLIATSPAKPADVQWAGRKGVLVCTGDLIDKGNQSVEVIELMRALQASAEKAGGQVIVTLGNHEAEFLAGNGETKKAAEFETELHAINIDPAAVAAGRDAGGFGAWLRERPIGAKVNGWFFCHAGNTGGQSIKELETAIEQGVDHDGFGAAVLSRPNSILEARAHPIPWWLDTGDGEKEKHHEKTDTGEKEKRHDEESSPGLSRLRDYVAALGCEHLVMGHQPDKIHFSAKLDRAAGEPFAYEGVLFLIDVGLSRGVLDGHGVVLKIHVSEKGKESASTIDEKGATAVLWER